MTKKRTKVNADNQKQVQTKETRSFAVSHPFELRKDADGKTYIEGYFSTVGNVYDMYEYLEVMQPGCFTKYLTKRLATGEVMALYGHDWNQVLGRTSSGSLSVDEDSKGLHFRLRIPDTQLGRDVTTLIGTGDLKGSSVGMFVVEDQWSKDDNGNIVRTILEVDVVEGSIVSMPANPGTNGTLGLRNAPASFLAEIKAKRGMKADDSTDDEDCDPDIDDDCEDEQRSCDCDCTACVDGDCEECTADDCDEDCPGCPMQDEVRSDRLRVRRLFALRMS